MGGSSIKNSAHFKDSVFPLPCFMALAHLDEKNELVFKIQNRIARVTLNRPQVLNALSYKMIEWIRHIVAARLYEGADVLMFEGAGDRAFCAGGDIKTVHAARGNDDVVFQYFGSEYAMNIALFHLTEIPTVALMNGITMGGGYGVAGQCKTRIATQKTIFAMPETAIGFFPDIGAAYHMMRYPDYTGFYLGLTGLPVSDPSDLLFLGVATHFIQADEIENVCANPLSVLSKPAVALPLGPVQHHLHKINAHFSKNSVIDILRSLEADQDAWAQDTLKILRSRCPVSLLVTFEHFKRAKQDDFNTVIARDFAMTQHVMARGDFYEGVRAAVIDKDKSPNWHPATVEDVPESLILAHFEPASHKLADLMA